MHYPRLGGKGLSGIDVHNGLAQRIRRCSLQRLRLHASILALHAARAQAHGLRFVDSRVGRVVRGRMRLTLSSRLTHHDKMDRVH